MDILLIIIGFVCVCLGLVGSFLPILPGPPISWIGFLMLYFTSIIKLSDTFLVVTFIIAVLVFALDYIIPALGTKKFGGSKAGIYGTSIGLLIGILSPIPFGIIVGPFLGALIGELSQKTDSKTAVKAAFGSFIGFVSSTLLKFIVSCIYFGLYVSKVWENVEPLI